MFPKWLRILPFLLFLLLVLHRCVWSPVSSPARPPTLPASRLHAGPLLLLFHRGVQRPFLFVDTSRPKSVWHLRSATVSAHKWKLSIVSWMLLISTFKTSPSHTMHAPHPERHIRHHMTFLLGFRGCARLRQQPGTFSVLSFITLAIHVLGHRRLFLCMQSEFAFLLTILLTSKIKFNHFAPSSHTFTSHGSYGLSFIYDADFWTHAYR